MNGASCSRLLAVILCYGVASATSAQLALASNNFDLAHSTPALDRSSSCRIESYDLTPLAAQPAWVVKEPCDTPGSAAECVYFFSLCHALPDNLPLSGQACAGSAACLEQVVPGRTNEWSSLGSFENNHQQALRDYPEFQIIYYGNGSSASDCQIILTFRCNENVSWAANISDTAQVIPSDSLILLHKFGSCSYVAQFHYDGACHIISPAVEPLSIGSYFVVALTGTVLLYIAVGVLVRLAMGHRGWDVIPHRNVWNGVGSYMAHGIICLTSPCRQKSQPSTPEDSGGGKSPDSSSNSKRSEKTPLLTAVRYTKEVDQSV